ncbi:MAG: PilZ domain-containing protein [Gammaproteobacteria bacterium]
MSPENPPQKNHRMFQRVSFDARAYLICAGVKTGTEVIDLSLKGALVVRPPEWQGAVGDNCRLEIQLSHDAAIEMDMVVAHQETDCIGFRCTHIDMESAGHLRRLIELNLGSPELLERELAALGAPLANP